VFDKAVKLGTIGFTSGMTADLARVKCLLVCVKYNSLRSGRYLGGGARVGEARGRMRRREKESEEKWEGRERNRYFFKNARCATRIHSKVSETFSDRKFIKTRAFDCQSAVFDR
jgi:hypothetical protein